MRVEFLIIGQGLCGTFLAWELQKAGRTFVVIDDLNPTSASRVASGIINPITGRRLVKTWMIDELLPFSLNAYQQIGSELNISCITEKPVIDFFPTVQMREAFLKRFNEDIQYLSLPEDEAAWRYHFHYDLGYGTILPSYLVDVTSLLAGFRQKLQKEQLVVESNFDFEDVVLSPESISYADITADKIIFCNGISSAQSNLFRNLPFAPNKGELLIVEIPGLPRTNIFKKGISIVPWKDELFWVGSSHEWKFDNDQPTALFLEHTKQQLSRFSKLPFKILEHLAAVRPATLERRPFIGFHPLYKNVGIFNGMGTKGCSLAPYFAKQLVDHICGKASILPE